MNNSKDPNPGEVCNVVECAGCNAQLRIYDDMKTTVGFTVTCDNCQRTETYPLDRIKPVQWYPR